MVDLAYLGGRGPVSLWSIAKRQGVSEPYLERVIAPLKTAGLIIGTRGAGGGYSINCNPKEVSAGDILKILEGPLLPVDCVSDEQGNACHGSNCLTCVTKPIWEKLYESMNSVLDSIRLSDLAEDYKRLLENQQELVL